MRRVQKLLAAGVGVLALALAVWGWRVAASDPFGARQVDLEAAPFGSLTYAYHTFLWYNPYDEMHLSWVRQSNFTHAKQVFAWKEIQPGPDVWSWARADDVVEMAANANVRLVARLSDAPAWAYSGVGDWHDAPPDDLNDFGTFCGELAARYAGRVHAYQVWNEPNLDREWGNQPPNAADYVDMLAACSVAIREADPSAVVISAGLSPTGGMGESAVRDDIYLQRMYDAGFSQYVDVVGVHAPGFSDVAYGPDDAERDGNGRWATFRRVEDMRKIMLQNGDAAKQIAILEMGWTVADEEKHPDYAWFAVDDEKQAEQLVAAYTYAAEHWRPWVGLMTTIYIADPAWDEDDEEMFFAVTLPNGSHRPAYGALGNMAKYCADGVIAPRDPGSPEAVGSEQPVPCS